MNEWTTVGVIAALAGLFFAFYTPLAQKSRRQTDERVEMEKRFAAERTERERSLDELQERHNRALIENTAAMTRLNASLESYAKSLAEFKSDNALSHRRLWDKTNEHESALAEHGTRITVLENRKES